MTSTQRPIAVPLLFSRAVPRSGSDRIPGAYSDANSVWLLDGEPIIKKSGIAELKTKTEAQLERDDDASPSLLEMQTKTLSQAERDDENLPHLLELMTKTSHVPERDD